MNDDLPPDFARLRTLETRAAHYLTRIRTWIATVERQQQTQVPTAAPPSRPVAGPRRARTPGWCLAEAGIGDPATEVHQGDCWARGGRW